MKSLKNEIITLEPADTVHIEGIWAVAQHEEIWEHLPVTLMTYEAVENYVAAMVKKREQLTDYPYVIKLTDSGKIIGSTTLMDISLEHKRAEIGSTWLTPDYWRSHINTNCKYLLLEYVFEELQLNRIQIKTGHENVRSQKAIERLGATKEGILRNHMIRKEGMIRHTVMYSIIRDEWPEVKQYFQQHLFKTRR